MTTNDESRMNIVLVIIALVAVNNFIVMIIGYWQDCRLPHDYKLDAYE